MEPNFDLSSICTSVQGDVFDTFFEGYNPIEREFVIQGFKKGFYLHFEGDTNFVVETPNMKSANKNPEKIWEKIAKEVNAGRVAGPFEKSLYQHYCSVLISVKPVRDLSKCQRTIVVSRESGCHTSVTVNQAKVRRSDN